MSFQYNSPFASNISKTLLVNTIPPLSQNHLRRILLEIGPIRMLRMDPPEVEFFSEISSEIAILAYDGQIVENSKISLKEPTTFNIFVGDIGQDISDEMLSAVFDMYPTFKNARVMFDLNTNKSKGYGFVTFGSREEAQQAIDEMNGVKLGKRNIRCNWASTKSSNFSYEAVLKQSSEYNTVVYVGNISQDPTHLAEKHGTILNAKVHYNRGFAFYTYSNHEQAATAIVALNGTLLDGKPMKCGWGKDGNNL